MRKCRGRIGLSLIELLVVLAIIGVLAGLVSCGVLAARQAAARLACGNNLRQVGLALHMYHESNGALPPGVAHPRSLPGVPLMHGPDLDPYPLLPWLGRILPYIEQGSLFARVEEAYAADPYILAAPPHDAHRVVVRTFFCPGDSRKTLPGEPAEATSGPTSYLGVSGTERGRDDGVLFVDSRVRLLEVTDGTSNTIMVGERPPSHDGFTGRWHGGWGFWSVADSTLGVREAGVGGMLRGCADGPYSFKPDRVANPCAVFHFWSVHPRGGHFLFVDGSVRFLAYSGNDLLPALATRAGGEPPASD